MKWKDIKGYEGFYQISNHGRVKSVLYNKNGKNNFILSPSKGNYLSVTLCKNSKKTYPTIHTLVWDHFGDSQRDGRKLQVDHKDCNKYNNHISNLQLLTQRPNVSKRNDITTSKYTGVSWYKPTSKWVAQIRENYQGKHLGYFDDEEDARDAYLEALEKINIR